MTNSPANPPPSPRNILAATLVTAFEPLLDHDPGADAPALLEQQARLLDLAFRRVLTAADAQGYLREDHYRLALRAQNQCRCTVKVLDDMRKK